MKDFICVSCWTSFQVDDATLAASPNVSCPKCGAVQPTSSSAVASAVMGSADDTQLDGHNDADGILDMLGDLGLGPSLSGPPAPLGMPMVATAPAAPDSGTGASLDDIWPPPPGSLNDGSHGWSLPADHADADGDASGPEHRGPSLAELAGDYDADSVAAPQDSAIGTLDRAIKQAEAASEETGSDLSAVRRYVAPPAAVRPPPTMVARYDADPAADDKVWRMKLSSGLVLSFPTIDMVVAWAKDKSPDSISIAHGDSEFQEYTVFQERYAQVQDPFEAFYGRGRSSSPGLVEALPTEAPSGPSAPVALVEEEAEVEISPVAPMIDDGEYADDPDHDPTAVAAAVAAAAAERPKVAGMYQQKYQFRTAPEPSGLPKALIIGLSLLLLSGGAVAVLLWQGII